MELDCSLLHAQAPTAWSVLSLISAVIASSSRFLKINFNVILPSLPRSSKWSLSLRSPYQNRMCTSPNPYTCHMPHPSHYFGFYPPHNLIKLYKSIFISELTNLSVFSSLVLCDYIRKFCRPKLLE
jgi:hypothetical protein